MIAISRFLTVHQNSFLAGALPRTSLQCCPRFSSWCKGARALLLRRGDGREGEVGHPVMQISGSSHWHSAYMLAGGTCPSVTLCVCVCVSRWVQVDPRACYRLRVTRSNDAHSNPVWDHDGWFLIRQSSRGALCCCCWCWTSDYVRASGPRCRLWSISRGPTDARLSHAHLWTVCVVQTKQELAQTTVIYLLKPSDKSRTQRLLAESGWLIPFLWRVHRWSKNRCKMMQFEIIWFFDIWALFETLMKSKPVTRARFNGV